MKASPDTEFTGSLKSEVDLLTSVPVALSRSSGDNRRMSNHETSGLTSFADGIDFDVDRSETASESPSGSPDVDIETQSWSLEFPKDEKEALEKLALVLRNAGSKEDVIKIALKVLRLAMTREVLIAPRSDLDEGVKVHLWL